MITLYPASIGTARPSEPVDALEACKHGAWVGDRERQAWQQTASDARAWAEMGARLPVRRRRREAA